MKVTKRIEFDAGHRLMRHGGKCRNLHGHRYSVEVTLEGQMRPDGMVVDFGDLKKMVWDIADKLDHKVMLEVGDSLIGVLDGVGEQVAVLPFPPSAEGLARYFYGELFINMERLGVSGVTLERVVVFETPTSSAECSGLFGNG